MPAVISEAQQHGNRERSRCSEYSTAVYLAIRKLPGAEDGIVKFGMSAQGLARVHIGVAIVTPVALGCPSSMVLNRAVSLSPFVFFALVLVAVEHIAEREFGS